MTVPLLPLDISRREGTSIEISRRLLDYLLSGRVQPGDRLPPERKLADALGVGRSVVREALKSLTLLGLLEVRLGDGTYVKRTDAEILPPSIEWGLALGTRHVVDLLEARGHLDSILAGLAALRHDEQDVVDLRHLVSQMKAAHREPSRFVATEAAFLREVAEVANNDVLMGTGATIRSLIQVWAQRVPYTAEEVVASAEQYAAVVDAIEAGNIEEAQQAMGLAAEQVSGRIRRALPADSPEDPAAG